VYDRTIFVIYRLYGVVAVLPQGSIVFYHPFHTLFEKAVASGGHPIIIYSEVNDAEAVENLTKVI